MKDTTVVSTEALPRREPIVVNRDVLYSFLSKEDADPQACWLEKKRQERIKAAKAALKASTSPTSSSVSVVDSKFGNVQQKVNSHQNQTRRTSSSSSSSKLSCDEALSKRDPIIVNRDEWYSFVCNEEADPQASWLERRQLERIKAAKAAQIAATSPTSSCGTSLDSFKIEKVQQKVNRNQNKTPSPPSSVTSTEEEVPRVDPRESSPKAYLSDDSSSGIKVNRHKGPSPPTSVVSSKEDDVPGKFSPKDHNLYCDLPSGIKGSNGKHFAKIGHYLNDIYEKEKLCDISFRLDNTVFPTHKVVLASQSKLFERIFQSKAFTEPPACANQIRVKGVSEKALDTFIHCMYTGNMHLIKPEYLPEILKLSQILEVQPITSMCYQLVSSLYNEDILHLLPEMVKAGEVKICDIIIDVIAKKFLDTKNCQSFFDLDFHSLCLILLNDGLNVNSEMEVFDTAVSWLHHHNVEERLKHLDQVMDTIRFSLLSHKDLMACFRKCPALKQSPHCVGLITMANWVQTSIDLKQQDPLNLEASKHRNVDIIGPSVEQYLSTHFSPDMKEPDVSFDIIPLTEESLKDFNLHACLGSQSWSTVSAAHVQQYSESKYTSMINSVPLKNIAKTGLGHAVSDVNQDNFTVTRNRQQYYDLSKKERGHRPKILQHAKKKERDRSLKQDPNKGQSDSREAMVWSGEFLYLVGGARYRESKGVYPTKKVMVHSYKSNEWKPVAPMNVPRMNHSLCVADGLLYAIGGVGKGNRILTSVECFNPRTNCWFFVKALPEPRAGATASAEGGNVCVQGGFGEQKNGQPSYFSEDEAIVYDVDSNKWTRKY